MLSRCIRWSSRLTFLQWKHCLFLTCHYHSSCIILMQHDSRTGCKPLQSLVSKWNREGWWIITLHFIGLTFTHLLLLMFLVTATVSYCNGYPFSKNVSRVVPRANTKFTPTHSSISFYKKSIYFKVFFRFGDWST